MVLWRVISITAASLDLFNNRELTVTILDLLLATVSILVLAVG